MHTRKIKLFTKIKQIVSFCSADKFAKLLPFSIGSFETRRTFPNLSIVRAKIVALLRVF